MKRDFKHCFWRTENVAEQFRELNFTHARFFININIDDIDMCVHAFNSIPCQTVHDSV